MTGVISGVITLKDKTNSNPLARQKVRISKFVGKFLVFPSVIMAREFSLPKGYQHQSMKVK